MQRLSVPDGPNGKSVVRLWRCWCRCFLVPNLMNMLTGDLDREVVEAVIVAKEGRVGVCIDICLEMSSGIQTPPESSETVRGRSEKSRSWSTATATAGADEADLLGIEGENGVGSISIEDKGRPFEERHGGQIDL